MKLPGAQPIGFLIGSAISTFLAVALIRSEASRRKFLDVPNERSSHTIPVPRGGGAGVMLVFALALLSARATMPWPLAFGPVLLGGLLVAAAGFVDDRASLSAHARLLIHLLAATSVAFFASTGTTAGWPQFLWLVWWVFWTVAAINVVNFIDGIDGMIALQAVIYGAYVAALAPQDGFAMLYGVAMAGCAFGFLLWNWAPARIFLGDVGSGGIGFFIAVGGLLLLKETATSVVIAFLPLGPIFLDAGVTLLRRWRRGERLTLAHRAHLYQRLARRWGHAPVTMLYGASAAAGAIVGSSASGWIDPLVGGYFGALVLLGTLLDRGFFFREERRPHARHYQSPAVELGSPKEMEE